MARRPPEQAANPARGAALVVVAVLVGLVLLRHGIDSDTSGSDRTKEETTDKGGSSGSTSSTSTTLATAHAPADVRVVVVNGSGTPQLAKKWSTSLSGKGYTNLTNANGVNFDGTTKPSSTIAYFATSADQADATAVAALVGPTVTTALLPVGFQAEVTGADVVVVLGADFANKPPAT